MTTTPSNPAKSLAATPSFSSPNGVLPGGSPAASIPFESSQRRPNQNQNPIATVIASHSAPRNGQASRKQHRRRQRPALDNASANTNPNTVSNTGPTLTDDSDDFASIPAVMRRSSNRRGQTNITHLLDLRPSYAASDRLLHRSYRRSAGALGSGHHPNDKARFVNANYRFVVSPYGNYEAQASDPDKHVDWSDVLQVLVSSASQADACPICLSEPVAPRMVRCGHVFCLPCLIRLTHTSLSDDDGAAGATATASTSASAFSRLPKWRKCPICEDPIYLTDARPVRFYAGQECAVPRPGHDVILRLMARAVGSTLALPRGSASGPADPSHDLPWHFAANVLDYARLMRGTGDYMVEQFTEEIHRLRELEAEDETLYGEDGEWTRRAVRSVEAAVETARGIVKTAEAAERDNVASLVARSQSDQPTATSAEPDYLYYFAAQPHLYLSPLDIRILKTKYGAFSAFPSSLLPRVEHISTGHSVDDAMRKRAKYLAHLPRGCVVSFLECDWTDIVPAETLAQFAPDLERRRRRNREAAAQAERERAQSERVERTMMRAAGAGVRRSGPISEEDEEDEMEAERAFDPAEFLPLEGGGIVSHNGHRSETEALEGQLSGSSAMRTVWGTPAVAGAVGGATASGRSETRANVLPNDGWLREEELELAGLAAELEGMGIDEDDGQEGGTGGKVNKRKKKKQKQKITLMSTGGRRGF